MTVIAVLPAHNEAANITSAVSSLQSQTRPPDVIWVIADNCTDDTGERAEAAGAYVFDTTPHNNSDKKAGALNLFLAELLPVAQPEEMILIMDADSQLEPVFIETALSYMENDPETIVGGVFYGTSGGGLVGMLQRNEYARYARDIYSKNDAAMVLTGTATMHRASVLTEITESRGTVLPGQRGQVYDTAVLTEDNEITLAIKTLGYKCVSPPECKVYTEIMPTWGDLWKQRLRWQRGAIENLRQYRLTPVTRPYVFQQSAMALGVFAMLAYMAVTIWAIQTGQFGVSWLSALGLIFIAERAVTVASRGKVQQLLAATLVLEFVYDLFLQVVLVKSIKDIATNRQANWHHI